MSRTVQSWVAVAILVLALVAFHWVVFSSDEDTRPDADIGTALYCERQPDNSIVCWER